MSPVVSTFAGASAFGSWHTTSLLPVTEIEYQVIGGGGASGGTNYYGGGNAGGKAEGTASTLSAGMTGVVTVGGAGSASSIVLNGTTYTGSGGAAGSTGSVSTTIPQSFGTGYGETVQLTTSNYGYNNSVFCAPISVYSVVSAGGPMWYVYSTGYFGGSLTQPFNSDLGAYINKGGHSAASQSVNALYYFDPYWGNVLYSTWYANPMYFTGDYNSGPGGANTGSGGGSNGSSQVSGGSGVVMVRYPISRKKLTATSGTVTYKSDGTYHIYTWTSTGGFTI